MSLLRSEGHVSAHHYPIWKVWEEARIVQRRVNRDRRTQATVMLMASSTAFSGGKKASKTFQKFLEDLTDGEDD